MATTSLWKVEGSVGRVVRYAGNPDKTEGPARAIAYAADPSKTERMLYVTGVNCLPGTAAEEMNATKRQFGKTGGIVAFHGYQSFAPGEADPQTAHEIGVSLARELWGDRFEVLVATHLDRGHLHNHFVINSVSFADGGRFHRDNRCYREMREASDRLCRERGLSVVESPAAGRTRHYAEWAAERAGRPTWRGLIREDVDEAIARATSLRQFYRNLGTIGYEVKVGKDVSVRPPGKERFVRLARNFGPGYTQEAIAQRIVASRRPGPPVRRPRPAPPPRPPKAPRGSVVALYRRYRYLLGGYRPGGGDAARTHFLLREDLRHLDRIDEEISLIEREGLETLADVAACRERIRSQRPTGDAARAARRDLRVLDRIERRTGEIASKLGRLDEGGAERERGERHGSDRPGR